MELFKKVSIEWLEKDVQLKFPISHFSIGEILYGGVIPVVVVKFSNSVDLSKNWREFNSYMAGQYIAPILDEYSKWNFYIFYFTSEKIEKTLKYEIENNKFSSRKIVIDVCSEITGKEINKVISEHITNDNMDIVLDLKKTEPFKKDVIIQKAVIQLPVKMTRINKEDALSKSLELIEKQLKDEI